MILTLLLIAVLPPLLLAVYFYLRDRYEPEPKGHVALAFLYGTLTLIPAVYVGKLLLRAVGPEWLALSGLAGRLYEDFLVAAAVEEVLKWSLFVATIARWREFDEPMDGVVYGATMALGLAAVENAYYVYTLRTWTVALPRGLFSVPAHALFGATMGYFIGRAKFEANRRFRVAFVGLSLVLPWLFHGIFDLICSYARGIAGWVALGVLSLAMWIFVLLAAGRALSLSPFRPEAEADADESA